MDEEIKKPRVKVNGVEYPMLMPTDLTLGELADAEKITGQGYELEQGGPGAFLALTYLSVRRVQPEVTVTEIRELVDEQIEFLRIEAEPLPPTSPADSSENGETTDDDS